MLERSEKNAILIVPESTGENTQHLQLNSAARINAFFAGVEGKLVEAGVGPLGPATPRAISGHSGAYVMLSKWGALAKQGSVPYFNSVQSIALLDATYGNNRGLADWSEVVRQNSSKSYFMTAYNPRDQTIGRNTAVLKSLVVGNGPGQRTGRDTITTGHEGRSVFIQSSTQHMQFMNTYMTDFLKKGLP